MQGMVLSSITITTVVAMMHGVLEAENETVVKTFLEKVII